MILPIYTYGSPVLKQENVNIDQTYPELQQLISDMYDTMANAQGVGLAAPQVGKSIRMFVIDLTPFAEDQPEFKDFKKTFINPEILERYGDKEAYNEGCLSFPKLYETVYRESKIKIKYFDENFVEHTDDFDGILARVIQHEYDHVEAKLFVERLSPIRRKLIYSKLKKLERGDFATFYKTKK